MFTHVLSAVRTGTAVAMVGLTGMLCVQHGGLALPVEAQAQPPAGTAVGVWNAAAARALLDNYCVTCHNVRSKTAGLTFDTLDLENLGAHVETWEKVIKKLRVRLMPPVGVRRPEQAATAALVSWLETSIDAQAATAPDPGRPVVQRLNRREYGNAIRDVLGLDIDVTELLPADNTGYGGFDNIGSVLSSSPGLLERYIIAAQKVSTRALGVADLDPSYGTYGFSKFDPQISRPNNDFPAGTRGVSVRHEFSADGEYDFTIEMDGRGSRISGIDEIVKTSTLDLRLDGQRARLFVLGGQDGADDGRQRLVGEVVDENILTVRLPVTQGTRIVSMVMPESVWMTEGVGPSRMPAGKGGRQTSEFSGKAETLVTSLRIEGPFAAVPSGERGVAWQRIMVCQPRAESEEIGCARKILSTLARRAYRRPVTDTDVEPLIGFFRIGRARGGFEAGILRALEALLVDPAFLFRIEQTPADAGRAYRVSDLDVASRLSFFLWSSVPDDELLDLAERGRLQEPGVLPSQVQRMLRDERASVLTRSFFGQWLGYNGITSAAPDRQVFPEFESSLRAAFQQETDLFFRAQIQEDRGVLELLTANYTYANERLAEHYGLPHVNGSHFRRVTLPDNRRVGILGHGSVLTTTSYATRTSPVLRGKWVLETLLGASPPPPPANVPAFEESAPADGQPATVRQQMERHRQNPVCASCHAMLDPLGFALENFSGVGRWRDKEHGVAIDASGSFPDGSKFDGPATFRGILLQQRETFLTTVTEKLLAYALGRGVGYRDMPAVRSIVREAAAEDYRWSAVILGIVESVPFQMKRGES